MVDRKERRENIVLENSRLLFRNFAGKKGKFNAAGQRNFAVVLENDVAAMMEAKGWNVKWLEPREEGETATAYLRVAVSYKVREPRVVLITSNGRTSIGEEQLDILDDVDILEADLIVSPYYWTVDGNTGIKAYLKSIYITIDEDPLERKHHIYGEEGMETPSYPMRERPSNDEPPF